ncbi:DNA polymerase, palm domain [Cinara cedri]|uniref:DNA polymerase, palm domain n=1 Tax=Cinara cedri TaxID=506608 RepID=A0A5E4N064_9HEMI|nr:DNA polymerase, palm domain [Cinara cedri]
MVLLRVDIRLKSLLSSRTYTKRSTRMFDKGIRCGLVQTSKRYAKANNHTMTDFDETKDNSWIIYQDCNNLYGWAMSQYMPHDGLKWIELTLDGLDELDYTSPIGRVYEVDIEYPENLHLEQFAVLDISKTMMYNHYNVMRKHFKNSIQLMYTDTDSLVYHIKTHDYYEDLLRKPGLLECTNTTNLPVNHKCFTAERKKIPGHFSEESDGRTITEFCALRAKTYAYKIDGKEKIKAKGIRGHVVKNHMTFDDHKKCLFGEDNLDRHRQNVSIRSFHHRLKTIITNKLTYNNYDDKMITLEDKINTMAYGYRDLLE